MTSVFVLFKCGNIHDCLVNLPLLIGFAGYNLCPRFQGVEQPPKRAQFGGVSVHSSLSLNLSSQHHNQRVICQAYSPVLAEGANTFFKLNVLCKSRVNHLFIYFFPWFVCCLLSTWGLAKRYGLHES